MHPDALALSSHGKAHLVNLLLIRECSKGQLVRVFENTVETHAQSPFAINSDHQGRLCNALVIISEFGLPDRPALEKTKSSYIVFRNIVDHPGHVIGSQVGMGADDHELGDL